MLTARIFDVYLYGEPIGRVSFIGPEFDMDAVRKHLIENERMNKDIIVKMVEEKKYD